MQRLLNDSGRLGGLEFANQQKFDYDRAKEQWESVLSNLHLSAGAQAFRSFDINKSPT